jgi:hypothetical protein
VTTDPSPLDGAAKISKRTMRILGRSLTIGELTICLAGLLVATVGAMAIDAHLTAGHSSHAGHGSGSSLSSRGASPRRNSARSRRSAISAPAPTQADAPDFPTQGGAQNGYGNFNAVSCASSSTCFAVGADNSGNGIASTSSNGGATWTSSTLPSGGSVRNSV